MKNNNTSHNPASWYQRITRSAGIVSFFTVLSRIFGLIRDMVIAKYFGATGVADAFFVAFRIPNLLRRLFAEGSLTIAFIPVFTEYLKKHSKEEAFLLARVIFTLVSVILVVLSILGILLSPWIVRIQAYGFGASGFKYELCVLLTRITFPYIFFISLVALFMGILNSLRHFSAPSAAPIFLNLGIIGSTIWLSPRLSQPIVGVAIGVIIGGVLQVLLQLPWLYRFGISLMPKWMPQHPAVKRIGRLMLPAIFGSAIYQFNQFINTLLASFLEDGSISWLYYADRLVQFPLGVFAIAVGTALLPSLSSQAIENQMERFTQTLNYFLKMVLFISISSLTGLIVIGKPIIQLFFERGAFTPHSTDMTYLALIYYSLGLWAFSGLRIMINAFYSLQDTLTPVKISALTFAINLALGLILMGPMKHSGLALALSISSSIQLLILMAMLKKRLKAWSIGWIFGDALKYVLASALMGFILHILYKKMLLLEIFSGTLRTTGMIFLLIITGVVIYFLFTTLLGANPFKFPPGKKIDR